MPQAGRRPPVLTAQQYAVESQIRY
jgi:hypothetical protein